MNNHWDKITLNEIYLVSFEDIWMICKEGVLGIKSRWLLSNSRHLA